MHPICFSSHLCSELTCFTVTYLITNVGLYICGTGIAKSKIKAAGAVVHQRGPVLHLGFLVRFAVKAQHLDQFRLEYHSDMKVGDFTIDEWLKFK